VEAISVHIFLYCETTFVTRTGLVQNDSRTYED